MGLFLDFMKWSQMFANRKEAATQTQKYYPSGAPRNTSAAAVSAAATAAAVDAPAPAPAPAPAVAPAAADAPASAGSAADSAELEKLDTLRASGALTDEEYEAAKAKLQG